MKKLWYAIAAFTAIVAVSCGKEQSVDIRPYSPEQVEINEKQVSIHASVKETKVLADNAGAFRWQNGDKITVVTAADVIREFTTTDTDTEADFSGTIPDADNVGAYALYPASDNHVAVGDMLAFNLDAEVVWNPNTSNMPMLGKISGSSASFKAVGGVLKLVLYNIPAEADYLQFVAKTKKITGEFDIDDATAANVVIETKVTDNAAEKELLIDFSGDYSDRKVFYIPLPTGTIDGFTINLLDSGKNVIFTQTTKDGVNLVVAANHLILGPALNCAKDVLLWEETFELYNANDVPSGEEGTGFGGVDVTYSVTNGGGTTKIYEQNNAGGTSPEILVGKNNGTFKASGIPTNGATTMSISFKENYNRITVSSTTEGVTVTDNSFVAQKYTATVNNVGGASTIDLVFTNTASSDNVRVDDISLVIPGTAFTVPTITTGADAITVAVGNLTSSTSYVLNDPVDNLGVAYILSGANTSWVSNVAISADRVTVTAASKSNPNPEDNTATLTLKASGATDKVLNLTQRSALVSKPTVSLVPDDESFSASWTKDEHATGYKAYLHSSETVTPATGGIELVPSVDGSTYSVSSSGLTNGSTYYLYVKVDGVATNYIEDTEYATVSFVPLKTVFYQKVTSNLDDWTGDYLIVWGTNAHYGISGSDFSVNAPVVISDNKITAEGHDSHKVTVEKDGGYYYIKLPSGKYLYNSASSGRDPQEGASKTQAYTFSVSSGNVTITGGSSKILYKNSSYYRFYATSGTFVLPMLFKLDNDTRLSAGLSWSKASDTATILTGDDTLPTISIGNPNSLSLNYSSSVPAVATINSSTGELTLVGAGETIITASFSGDATYKPGSVSYTLAVTDDRTACATPSFSPAEGEVDANTSVTITSATTGSTIYYTTDGSEPNTSSSHGTVGAASASVSIDVAKTVKAIAVKDDWKYSAVASADYTLSSSGIGPETIDFSTLGLTNGVAYNTPFDGGHFTVTFNAGGNNGKYYSTGTAIRTYGGGSFVIASSYTIASIKFTFSSGEDANSITPSVGTFSTDTWTGSSNSITFTIGGSSGHRRIKSIKVIYSGSGSGGGGGGGVPPTPSGLPQYLGCYEMPAIDLVDDSSYTNTGTESFGSTNWYEYDTNNAKQKVVTHTYEYSSNLYRNYTFLIDQDKRCALWTAYPMHAEAYPNNDIKRGDWCYDPALPNSWQSSGSTDDYNSGDGYSRGHHCASEDRQACRYANDQTFYYTNQTPQWQNNFNGGMWGSLETAIQSNAPSGRDTLYVVVGTIFDPLNMHASNDGGNVGRPSHFYKLLMMCSFDGDGNMTDADGVAYLYTNEAHTSGTYNDATFRKTIDYIETLTGFDFFANVPTSLQTTAEAQSASLW